MTISEVCQQMDQIVKIPILFLEDCIWTQLECSNYSFNDKEVTEWVVSPSGERFNHRSKDVSSRAWPLNASVILTHVSWKWKIKVLLKE